MQYINEMSLEFQFIFWLALKWLGSITCGCRTLPPGVEYVLFSAQPPHLFVIKKQFRQGPDAATAQSLYYVHTGTIYQVQINGKP